MPNDNELTETRTETRRIPPEFDLAEAVKLRISNCMSFGSISKYYGVPKATIIHRLRKIMGLISDPQGNLAYERSRAAIMTGVERVLVEQLLSTDKLKSASLNNVAYTLSQVTAARRLEEGKSTDNQSVSVRIVRFGEQDQLED